MAWLAVLNQNYLPLYQTDLADAIETSYYWIDSVDKVSFDATQNEFTFDATILFASVYENDLQEWQDDTWDFFRDYAKDIWIPLMEGVNDAWTKDLGTPEWRQWTSSVLLDGNAGRLTVECPGSLIFDLTGRAATQADFQEICTFGN